MPGTEEAPSTAQVDASTTPEALAEVETQTTEQVESADTEAGDDSPKDGKDDAKSEAEAVRKKMQRRIDRLTADRAAAQERARALEAAAEEAARAKDEEDGKPPKAEDPREIAKQLVLAQETAKATNRMLKDAKAKFPEFEKNITELVEEVGPLIDRKTGAPTPLLEAVIDSDSSTEVLNWLGENPEVAAELVGLSQARIGRRIAQIEADLAAKAKPKTSAAAKPLTPVKPAATVQVDPAKLTDKQWFEARRKAQKRA